MNLKNEFTKRELEFLRNECNFTPDELAVFELRTKGMSIVQICMELFISEATVGRRINSIKRKIQRVL